MKPMDVFMAIPIVALGCVLLAILGFVIYSAMQGSIPAIIFLVGSIFALWFGAAEDHFEKRK